MGVLYGRALVQPTTIDQEAREVDVVCATEKMVTRFGWEEDYDEMLVCEAGGYQDGPCKSRLTALGLPQRLHRS